MLLLLQGNSRWRYYREPTRITTKEVEQVTKKVDIFPVLVHLHSLQIYEVESVETNERRRP